jgi:hypothetical protein
MGDLFPSQLRSERIAPVLPGTLATSGIRLRKLDGYQTITESTRAEAA